MDNWVLGELDDIAVLPCSAVEHDGLQAPKRRPPFRRWAVASVVWIEHGPAIAAAFEHLPGVDVRVYGPTAR